MKRPQKIRIGEMLIQQSLLTPEQVQAALEDQRRSGRKLGRILVENGYISELALSQALARQLAVPFLDLRQYPLEAPVVRRLPEAQARRFRAVVLEETGEGFRVGMADPTDIYAYDEICRVLKREIDIAVATETDLLAVIDRFYQRTDEITGFAQALTAELADAPSQLGNPFGLSAGQEDAPVVRLLQTVFEEAVRLRASDIHIEPQEKSLVFRLRIDGVLHVQTETDTKIAPALVLRLKLMSGLDISEKRLPQDGRFHVAIRERPVDIRLSTLPTQYGESVVMRLLVQQGGVVRLDRLGMPDAVLSRLRAAIHRPSGMILVTGPTGSGKTTTLYAALTELNTTERKIITVEDPVEYRLPGINQVQVNEKIDLSFDRVLRASLRQDPDTILVGEMRDRTTAEIGLRAAMTGHMVLSTLHTNDAASTPMRLLDMGVPAYMVALSLQLVLAQRLVRVLCEACAQPHAPDEQEMEWLLQELGADARNGRYRRGAGCHACGGTGYVGRTGVYEVLEMSRPLVEAATRGDPEAFTRLAEQQMAGRTLQRDAARLVAEGRTTVAEAIKVANQLAEEV